MLERLANVIFWTGNIFAALSILIGIIAALNERHNGWIVLSAFFVFAVIIWVRARAIKYVLIGNTPK